MKLSVGEVAVGEIVIGKVVLGKLCWGSCGGEVAVGKQLNTFSSIKIILSIFS